MKDKPPAPNLPRDWEPSHRRPHGSFDLRIPGFADGTVTLFFPRPPLDRVVPETESMVHRAARENTLLSIYRTARKYIRAVRADYDKPAPNESDLKYLATAIIDLNYDCPAADVQILLSGEKWKGLTRGYLAALIRRKR